MNALSPQIVEALVGSTALSPIDADAGMIAVCEAICAGERAYDATGFKHESRSAEDKAAEQERARISDEQDKLVERLCELPCTTMTGVKAMARALAAWDRELLKDGPGRDNGEVITSQMVDRILALRASPADADLLAACAEFCESEIILCQICDAEPELSDEERDALIEPICRSWDGMLDRMASLRATTLEGLAARALALAQHSGIKPDSKSYAFDFDPNNRESVTGRLLHMLLTDAVQICGTPLPSPDADLLALRPEFDRLHALMIAYNEDLIPDDGTECADFDDLCNRIAVSLPAVTREGRAFQAAAAMHHLSYRLSSGDEKRNPTWLMLKGLAGSAFQSVETRS